MGRKYRLDNSRGTVLVGEFDVYVEESVERTAGWWGPATETSLGYVDFIIDGGPVVRLDAVDGYPVGWNAITTDSED